MGYDYFLCYVLQQIKMGKYFVAPPIKRLSPSPYPLKRGCLETCFDQRMQQQLCCMNSRLGLKQPCSFHLHPLRMFPVSRKEHQATLLKGKRSCEEGQSAVKLGHVSEAILAHPAPAEPPGNYS